MKMRGFERRAKRDCDKGEEGAMIGRLCEAERRIEGTDGERD